MDYNILLSFCSDVLQTFKPSVISMEDHVSDFISQNINDRNDVANFLKEVFSGCVRYKDIISVVTSGFYKTEGRNILHLHESTLRVLTYLIIFRLDEIGISKLKLFLNVLPLSIAYRYAKVMFNEKAILTWMKDQWDRTYEVGFVKNNLVDPLLRYLSEFTTILESMEAKIDNKCSSKRGDRVHKNIVPKPFNLTAPTARGVPLPDALPQLCVYPKVPDFLFLRKPKEFEIIEQKREENRLQAENLLLDANRLKPACAVSELSLKTRKKLDTIVEMENAKLQFNFCTARRSPGKKAQNSIPVRLTMASVLREAARFKREEEEVMKKLEALEAGTRDSSEFDKWQSEMRKKDLTEAKLEMEEKKLESKITREEAILARLRVEEENKKLAVRMKKEAAERLQEYWKVQQEEKKNMQQLVEKIITNHVNAKKSKIRLRQMKQKIVQQMNAEGKELMRQALEEAEEDMRKRIKVIQEIRSFESVRVPHVNRVDLTECGNYGYLSEMSLVELRERLSILRKQREVEEEQRRDNIIQSKEEKDRMMMETLAIISKHRDQKTRTNAIKLEKRKQDFRDGTQLKGMELQSEEKNRVAVLEKKLISAKKKKQSMKTESSFFEDIKSSKINCSSEERKKADAMAIKIVQNKSAMRIMAV